MKKLKYIIYAILILILSMGVTLAADEEKSDELDDEQVEALVKALIEFDKAVDSEDIDVIKLGQMLRDGLIDPVSSKSSRDNPFDESQEPVINQKQYNDGFIGPLPPPPIFQWETEIQPEISIQEIVNKIKLVGIMELGEGNSIAIMRMDGRQKSYKVGDKFEDDVTLLITEIGDDYVVFSTEDGELKAWVGFSFAKPEL